MTKLEQLNVFLSERLSAAVNEILDTVSRMMQEYEEETARIRKDNDYLKEMLTLTGWSFTELNSGVSFEKQDGMSNLQHESETWEGWCQNPELKEESTSIKIEQPDPPFPAHPDSEHTDRWSKVIYTHSDEEESAAQNAHMHICQHCSATFCSPYHLRRHEYTHTGERPFWCSECNMGFIQKYRYRNHRMIHHALTRRATRDLKVCCGIWYQDVSSRFFKS
ncbi:hypothetical protein QTP70_020358, partial [Hemibagrus guttatus]